MQYFIWTSMNLIYKYQIAIGFKDSVEMYLLDLND